MVGVAVTMLNRRNIKTWVSATWQRAHRAAPQPPADEPAPEAPRADRVPAGV